MNESMYRQIIMDHYKNPMNKKEEELEGYESKEALNPSCGDKVTIYVLEENGIIKDIKWDGSGCSICCASSSVMTQELKGLTKEELIDKVIKFEKMVHDGEIDDVFEDAQAFSGVSKFPMRFKCAFISWDQASKIIKGES